MSETTTIRSIPARATAVKAEIQRVSKDQKDKKEGWKYASIDQILDEVREKTADHGLDFHISMDEGGVQVEDGRSFIYLKASMWFSCDDGAGGETHEAPQQAVHRTRLQAGLVSDLRQGQAGSRS